MFNSDWLVVACRRTEYCASMVPDNSDRNNQDDTLAAEMDS